MAYPWSNKTKEEETDKEEVIEKEEVIIEKEPTIESDEYIIENTENEKETIVWDNDDPRAILLNILKNKQELFNF